MTVVIILRNVYGDNEHVTQICMPFQVMQSNVKVLFQEVICHKYHFIIFGYSFLKALKRTSGQMIRKSHVQLVNY